MLYDLLKCVNIKVLINIGALVGLCYVFLSGLTAKEKCGEKTG